MDFNMHVETCGAKLSRMWYVCSSLCVMHAEPTKITFPPFFCHKEGRFENKWKKFFITGSNKILASRWHGNSSSNCLLSVN
jgi:hypothetical protein